MRRFLPLALVLFLLLPHALATAMGEKKTVPLREDKVTYSEVIEDHPQLKDIVNEDGFNSLSGKEQWELITMTDRYAFFRYEAEYYAGESPTQSIMYTRKANSLEEEMKARFGHVLKEGFPPETSRARK